MSVCECIFLSPLQVSIREQISEVKLPIGLNYIQQYLYRVLVIIALLVQEMYLGKSFGPRSSRLANY